MSHFLLTVALVVALAVGGCAPPDNQAEGAGDKQRAERGAEDGAPGHTT